MSQAEFYRHLEKHGFLPRRAYYGMINTGIDELNQCLKSKDSNIVKRCLGKPSYLSDNYSGLYYVPIYHWVEFCNRNRCLLIKLWNKYIESGRQPSMAVSIDRIEESGGYSLDNMQFVTQGFNAWKRNINPISVEFQGVVKYFMSGAEASRYYGENHKIINGILSGMYPKMGEKYKPKRATIVDTLRNNDVISIEEYYENIFNFKE